MAVVRGSLVRSAMMQPMGMVEELHRITKPGGLIRIVTPHYTNPDWANDLTHRNHLNSYSFNQFQPEKKVFDFYTEAVLSQRRAKVSLLALWKAIGIEFLVNLDEKYRSLRFIRKFWEQYLCFLFRGKQLTFTLEVVKADN